MNTVLITGASGFVGSALIPRLLEKGNRVYGLSRHPPSAKENLLALPGDITEPNLGLESVPKDIDSIYHLAGIHSLGEDKEGSIWKTNVVGTRNVLEFCLKHDIPRLYFASTAYTWSVNPYGLSKIENEEDIKNFAKKHDLKVTIFKPSVIMGTEEHPYPGHFSQFVLAIIKIHQRAELVRRKLEGTLHLPVIEPLFRIKANPGGKLNLIQIDQVIWAMSNIEDAGTFWLTNPNPPTIQQLLDWIGEFIMLRIVAEPKKFKAQPVEATFQKGMTAFQPYLQGDDFPSNLQLSPPITREFIHSTIKRTLIS